MKRESWGTILSWVGAIIGIAGSLVNTLWLSHNLAILIWMISNPILVVYAYGGAKKWWNGGLSFEALVAMYLVYTISGIYAIIVGGML